MLRGPMPLQVQKGRHQSYDRTERAEWDVHGNHLCGQCGYGGCRIKRHGDIARVLLRFLRAAGFRATDKCFDVCPACPAGEGSTKYTKRIPDIVATDQYGTTTAYDVMVTHPVGSTAAAHRPLYAATKGEKCKQTGHKKNTGPPGAPCRWSGGDAFRSARRATACWLSGWVWTGPQTSYPDSLAFFPARRVP